MGTRGDTEWHDHHVKQVLKKVNFSAEINPFIYRNQYKSYIYEGATSVNYHAE